ncbi:MAG: flavin reductase [Acidobacteria bacterium]|nr:flavin reductase [Acidobacteriota bacterium]
MDVEAYRSRAADIAGAVAVITAVHRGRDYAATITGLLDVSYDPPTMLVSLFDEGRICDAVAASGVWNLSLLTRSQQGIANWLASPGNPVEGLLNNVPIMRGENGVAVISGCLASFELVTVQSVQAATHQLFIGEVTAVASHATPAEQDRPLIHFAREYKTLG